VLDAYGNTASSGAVVDTLNTTTLTDGTISLGGYGNTVTTNGTGATDTWNITAGSGGSTINVGSATDNIVLNGSLDTVNIRSGLATVTGVGLDTTYAMTDINGGLSVANFNAAADDVLSLTGIESELTAAHTHYYVSASQDSVNHAALDVYVVTGSPGSFVIHEVASLNGADSSSLAGLEATHNILA